MQPTNIDLVKLRQALVLAETGSFTVAAENLHISQSALSRSIRALEEDCGIRLFDRGRRGAAPTIEGREFLRFGRETYAAALRLEALGHNLAAGEAGDVTIGLGASVAHVVLPDLLVRAAEAWPGLSLIVRTAPADILLEEVTGGECDFAAMAFRDAVDMHALEVERLTAPVRSGLFVRPDHPLARRRRLDRACLAEHTIAASAASIGEFRRAFGSRQRAVICEHSESLRALAVGSDVIWATLEPLARPDIRRGQLVELAWTGSSAAPSVEVPIARFSHRRLGMTPAASNISSLVALILAEKVGPEA